jgi:hypothetical protein
MSASDSRRVPVPAPLWPYLRMLCGILLTYALVIGFGGTAAGDTFRVVVFGWVLWTALRLRGPFHRSRWLISAVAVLTLVTASSAVGGSVRLEYVVVGVGMFVLLSALVLAIGADLARTARGAGWVVDGVTVVGVLCIYLLLAQLFGAVHQIFAAFITPYVHGTGSPPSPSDLLYFSVITMTTVGFGDITPASEAARAVTVLEALLGQLYLVSVVAAVVSGWRPRR